MSKRDYYEILGLEKTCSDEEIKKAYRKLAMEFHPDRNPDNKEAEEKFKEIAEAYETLSDSGKRQQYDRMGHNAFGGDGGHGFGGHGFGGHGFGGMQDMFREFMARGGGFNRPNVRKGDDLNLVIKLTLEEIFTGVNRDFKYKKYNTCTPCGGKGGTKVVNCGKCQGHGQFVNVTQTPFGHIQTVSVCDACEGMGTVVESPCEACNGSGVTQDAEDVNVGIPVGVIDGMTMVLEDKGHAVKNGTSGRLIVTIMELPHEYYTRNGNDLRYTLNLTYPQLVLGDKVEVPTIEGTKIRVLIPEFSKVGDILKIPAKGLMNMDEKTRGDMLITLNLTIPKSLTDEERTLIESLKKISEKVATS